MKSLGLTNTVNWADAVAPSSLDTVSVYVVVSEGITTPLEISGRVLGKGGTKSWLLVMSTRVALRTSQLSVDSAPTRIVVGWALKLTMVGKSALTSTVVCAVVHSFAELQAERT